MAILDEIGFQLIQERFDAYWRREDTGIPLVAITCPRDDAPAIDFPVPNTAEGRWTDVQYQCRLARRRARITVYLGDAFPMFMPSIGPDSFTAYLGGDLAFLDDTTSWVRPFVEDLADYTPAFDRTNRWWRYMMELIDALCETAQGDFFIGIPDLHGGGDALAAMRHPDRLALDMYDRADDVRRIMGGLTAIYRDVYDEYYARLAGVQSGSTTWIPAYSSGKYTALQNDFSGLISPRMFVDFFRDEVRELAQFLDNSLYHLDGPGALGNLPHLLDIEELDGIQWVPGAGAKPMAQWLDVCRRVLDAGKCLQISAEPQEVTYLLENLPHAGLFICTHCTNETEGRTLWQEVERLARTGRS